MTETFSKNRMFDARGVLDENDPQFGAGGLYDPNGQFALERKAILDKNFQEQRQVHLPDASRQAMAADVGLVRTNDNSNYYTTPSMQFADVTRREARARQQLDYEKFKEIRNSVGFRVGDTLADTGRAFLSPLFWLGGEDTTRFDPSAKLEARYREGFRTNEKIREQSYLLAEQSRTNRKQALETMRLNEITSGVSVANLKINQAKQNAPYANMTTDMANFANFVDNIGGTGTYADISMGGNPDEIRRFQNLYALEKNEAMQLQPVGDFAPVVVRNKVIDQVDKIAQRFDTKGFREAIVKYDQLISALESESAIGDIAAVFSFMKALDPTSVVRESEYSVVAGAGGYWEKMKKLEDQVRDGTFLIDQVKGDLSILSKDLMASYMTSYDLGRQSLETKLGTFGFRQDNGLAQPYLGSDLFSRFRPQQPQQIDHSQYITGTADDGKNIYDRGNGTYILDDDDVTEIPVKYGEE